MYELFGDTAVRVLLAIRPGDSIRRVAHRIQTPYETVRQAVNDLEAAGFVEYDDGLYVAADRTREAARQFLAASAHTSPPSIDEAYVVPQFGDREFAFTRIDAVYVWTEGGYQVGRSPDDYPLFVAVRDADVEYWEAFFEQFGLLTALERQPVEAIDGPIQVVLEPRRDLDVDWVEGRPVVPRDEAIEYMRENVAHFQPALSMLDDMYDDLDLNVAYRESERASK
jgi:hypothetical protein